MSIKYSPSTANVSGDEFHRGNATRNSTQRDNFVRNNPSNQAVNQKDKVYRNNVQCRSRGRRKEASHIRSSRLETFHLFSSSDNSLERASRYVKSASAGGQKACVLSVISKQPLNDSTKDHLIQTLLQSDRRSIWGQNKISETVEQSDVSPVDTGLADLYDSQVIGQIDFKSGLVILNLVSFQDTHKLISLSQEAANCGGTKSRQPPLNHIWPQWNQNLLKTMLILFSVSHLIVFYSPVPSIDFGLIQRLKILEMLRADSRSKIMNMLKSKAAIQEFPVEWTHQARICCPRALFVCDTRLNQVAERADLIEMKRDLENHIGRVLSKIHFKRDDDSQSTSRTYDNGLFYMPERGDFVFILTKSRPENLEAPSDGAKSNKFNEQQTNRSHGDFEVSELLKFLELQDRPNAPESSSNIGRPPRRDDSSGSSLPPITGERFSCDRIEKQCYLYRRFIYRHISDIRSQADRISSTSRLSESSAPMVRYGDFFTLLIGLKELLFPLRQHNVDESAGKPHVTTAEHGPFHLSSNNAARGSVPEPEVAEFGRHTRFNRARVSSGRRTKVASIADQTRPGTETGSVAGMVRHVLKRPNNSD